MEVLENQKVRAAGGMERATDLMCFFPSPLRGEGKSLREKKARGRLHTAARSNRVKHLIAGRYGLLFLARCKKHAGMAVCFFVLLQYTETISQWQTHNSE